MRPLVSILIVNFNGAEFLGNCLDSLDRLQYLNYEIIVVDNASSDASRILIESHRSCKTVWSDQNLGFAGGNNLGLRHCSGELILLLNSDTVVHPGFLTPLVDYLDTHPRVQVVQGKMVIPSQSGRLDVCGSYLTPLGFPYHRGYLKPDNATTSKNYPIFCGKGACLLLRQSAIDFAGGFLFDDDFFCYYEESDFCSRVWIGGGEVHFVGSGPAIVHLNGATSGKMGLSTFSLEHYLKNQTFTLCSNLQFTTALQVTPLYFAMLCASLAWHLIQGKGRASLAHLNALLIPCTDFLKIRARRRFIHRIRRQSDRSFWGLICIWPGWRYFLLTAQNRLQFFEDPTEALGKGT